MRTEMHEYFDGEWTEAYFWLAGGIPALGTGIGFLAGGNPTFKGASAPLLLFGLIQTAAGIFLFGRTRGQVHALDALLDGNPRAYAEQESERMEGVNRGFSWYKPVELAFLGAGAILTANGVNPKNGLLLGMGIATMLEAVVMLVFDAFAGSRAEVYTERIHAFLRTNP
ncbi:MAG: hypothetical protein QM723_27050 [Myxococcaceae bacterium]